MKGWLGRLMQGLRERRRLAGEIDPASFRTLARELRELAELAERLWPQHPKFLAKIKRIQSEMAQLDELTARPEFRRLSTEKKLLLRESLIQSRDQLMETVKTAPFPGDERTRISPGCALTISETMESPKPVPFQGGLVVK